jgi:2-hydroxychromene-2-carboxylate isomerase
MTGNRPRPLKATGKIRMQATWYFDFVSPFAYLQLRRILALRERLDIAPKPIVFAALLGQHGQLGPAEIAGKREFTYRFVQWQAERDGLALRFPATHPFNPLAALRLCIAAGSDWNAVSAIFDHLWRTGGGSDAGELGAVGRVLGVDDVAAAIGGSAVKAQLRENTDQAIAAGLFGVPTLRVGTELFWGNDATPMIEAWLDDPDLFQSSTYKRLASLPAGAQRPR